MRVLVIVTYITLMLINHYYIMGEPTVSIQILPEMNVELLAYLNLETIGICFRLICAVDVVTKLLKLWG